MKLLLALTAAIESGAGLALLISPSVVVLLLAGVPLETPAALTVARIGGAGLLSLGVACWLARNEGGNGASRGIVVAMLVYNVAAVAIVAYGGIGLRLHGLALWPGVGLHTLMAGWCGMCLWPAKHTT